MNFINKCALIVFYNLIAVVLLLCVVEYISFKHYTNIQQKIASEDKRSNSPSYNGYIDDIDDFYREYKIVGVLSEYSPFVLWKGKEYSGKYHNIGKDGYRITENNSSDINAKKVFMFGGSSMWGSGSNDTYTIPSVLAKELNELDSYKVYNYGVNGHMSSNELVNFVLKLKNGERPDYVVFFDGGNDSYSGSFYPGKPDAHLRYNHIRDSFRFGAKYAFDHVLNNFYFLKLYKYYSNKQNVVNTITVPESKLERVRAAAPLTAKNWIDNIQFILGLSKLYDFQPIIILQPTIYTKDTLSQYEMGIVGDNNNLRLKVAYTITYPFMLNEIKKNTNEAIYDFTGVFNGNVKDTFIDSIHLSPYGNEVIAREIATIIKEKENEK